MTCDNCNEETAVGFCKPDRITLVYDKPNGKSISGLDSGTRIDIKKIELIREIHISYWIETVDGYWIPLQDIMLD